MPASQPEIEPLGHEIQMAALQRAVSMNRLGHAQLIVGPPQVGKEMLALWCTQLLLCSADVADHPCGQCRACGLVARLVHPDVHVVRPQDGSLKIEAVRQLRTQLSLAPVEARWRVCLLLDMHAATPEAANCLLKTLEEPPSRVVLILTATDVAALPETVVSRCQVTALRRVAEEAIARLLERRHGLTSEHALQLARLSDGRPRWAVMVAEQPKVWENRRVALDSLARALRADRVERLQLAAELGSGEDLIQTLLHWQSWWRDLMLLRHGYSDAVINRDRMTELERTAVAAEKVYQTLRAIQLAMDQIRANANSRLATEVLLLRLPALAGPA